MAEVVASALGITTFGFQIGQKLYELTRLYKDFASAPGDIEAIVADCERLTGLLDALKSQWSLVGSLLSSDPVLDKCCANCEGALGKLDSIARDLKSRISKSRVKGSMKALLRKDELFKQREQLRTAKEDILIASQIMDSAMLRQLMLTQMSLPPMMNSLLQQLQQQQHQQTQPQLQHQQRPNLLHMATATSLMPTSYAAPRSFNNPQARRLTPSKVDLRKRRQLQFQWHWIGKAWHIETIGVLGDWTFHFRTWNVLGDIDDTPVATCMIKDDLLGFQQLVTSGRYTMYDRDKDSTMFEYAIMWGSVNIIEYYLSRDEWTLEQCISDSFIDSAGLFPYGNFIDRISFYVNSRDHERYLLLLKALFQTILLGGLIDGCAPAIDDVSMLALYSDSSEEQGKGPGGDVARQITDGLFLHRPDVDFNERMQYTIQLADVEDAWLFWHFLGRDDLDHACVEAEALKTSGSTLLTRCAKSLTKHRCKVNGELLNRQKANHLHHTCECSFDEAYVKLVRQAFELGDLERSFSRGKSLLLLVTESMAGRWWLSAKAVDVVLQAVNAHVHLWLKILYCAGVDLDQYGQQEYEYLKVNADNEIVIAADEEETPRHARLINFQWGKTLDNWQFWWSNSMDEINNTFLLHHAASSKNTSKTEASNLHVPGAWVETQEERSNLVYEDEIRRRARSRRRRKRYLTAAGRNMRDAREVFGKRDFHGWRYRPKVSREDCLAYCYKYSDCRYRPRLAG